MAMVMGLLFNVCGYHRAGLGKSLPPNIKTIAIPTFHNSSLEYRVEDRFTQAVMDEILRRGRSIRVTSNPEGADAVITGDIRRVHTTGTILDSQGRTRVWQITVSVSILIRDTRTRQILYQNPSLNFSNEYELSDDPKSFFNEANPALDRIARDFAQSVVSNIMEGM